MSTRAVYSFIEKGEAFHVYLHHDGYPTGAAQWIEAAKAQAWPLPRYEADEFAAAFVAANKSGGGGVRLLRTGAPKTVAPADIEYRYEIRAKRAGLIVKAIRTNYWDEPRKETVLFNGTLQDFAAWAEEEEKNKV